MMHQCSSSNKTNSCMEMEAEMVAKQGPVNYAKYQKKILKSVNIRPIPKSQVFDSGLWEGCWEKVKSDPVTY